MLCSPHLGRQGGGFKCGDAVSRLDHTLSSMIGVVAFACAVQGTTLWPPATAPPYGSKHAVSLPSGPSYE